MHKMNLKTRMSRCTRGLHVKIYMMTRARGFACATLSHCYTRKAGSPTCTLFVLSSIDIISLIYVTLQLCQIEKPCEPWESVCWLSVRAC
jgi:hypothetical protein